jgi:hypothetical protein
MQNKISLETMTYEEKVSLMEAIWADLAKTSAESSPPDWHLEILKKRSEIVDSGGETYMDAREAIAQLRAGRP